MELNDKLIYASDIRKAILRQEPRLAYLVEGVRAVDAKEVIHAHWIHKPLETDGDLWLYHCSACGNLSARPRAYCAECGAKMEEKVEYADEC